MNTADQRCCVLFSEDLELLKTIREKLDSYKPGLYEIKVSNAIEKIDEIDVYLVDSALLGENFLDKLATFSFTLAPSPTLLLADNVQDPKAYSSIKNFVTDYLSKEHLTASSLHNSITYIIESVQLKRRIDRTQRRYESVFYNALDPSIFLNPNLVVDDYNNAFSNIFPEASSSGQLKLSDLFKNTVEFEEVKNYLEDKIAVDRNVLILRPDNTSFLAHIKINPILEPDVGEEGIENKLIGFHANFVDISHEQRINQIKERVKHVSSTYRLARTLAHEIRNPLTNLNLSASQLQELVKDEEAELYLDIIHRSGERINNLITQLLHSSEQVKLQKKPLSIQDILNRLAEQSSDRCKLRGVELNRMFTESDDLEIEGEPERLTLAFSNILNNALEAVNSNTGKIEIDYRLDQNFVEVAISDNGIGMDEETQERLFDPFYTNKSDGVGLGMTAVQTIITEHSGEINIESKPNVGSTFKISLPIQK